MILDPNHSHVYATKAVCSLSNLEKGEKGTNLALFFNWQAADLRYTQKQREDPKFRRQHQDERTIENT